MTRTLEKLDKNIIIDAPRQIGVRGEEVEETVRNMVGNLVG